MADPLAQASVSRGGDSVALLGNAVTTDPNAPLVSTSVTGDDHGIGACGDAHAESPSIARAAAPAAVTAWTGKQSFAHIVSPPLRSSTSPVTSSSLTASEIQRQQSTFIVRRAPPDMSPQGAVKTIADQMRLPPGALFESALRDPQDRRRLYLVFKTPSLKQSVAAKGFKLGNVTIKPSDGALRGYIPFPPYFVDTTSLLVQLSKHGHVTEHKFVTTSDGIRVAGFQFALQLKPSAIPPREIQYGGHKMAVRYSDDLRRCGFCHSFGHTVRFCRKRAAAEEERHLRATLQPDTVKATEGALPVEIPVDPTTTGDDPPVETDEESKLRALWDQALATSIKDEDTTFQELLLDVFCRMSSVRDIAASLKLDEHHQTAVDVAAEEITRQIIRDWRTEWCNLKLRFRDQRREDHEAFVCKGLKAQLPEELQYIPVAPAEPDFATFRPTSDQELDYVQRFGLLQQFTNQFKSRLAELIDEDMSISDEKDVDHQSIVSSVIDVEVLSARHSIQSRTKLAGNSPAKTTATFTSEPSAAPLEKPDFDVTDEHHRLFVQDCPSGFNKRHCPFAVKIDSDVDPRAVQRAARSYTYKNCFDSADNLLYNPLTVLALGHTKTTILLYVPTEDLGNLLRVHLASQVELRVTKVGTVHKNKKYREVAS